jgi:hypothetical protein
MMLSSKYLPMLWTSNLPSSLGLCSQGITECTLVGLAYLQDGGTLMLLNVSSYRVIILNTWHSRAFNFVMCVQSEMTLRQYMNSCWTGWLDIKCWKCYLLLIICSRIIGKNDMDVLYESFCIYQLTLEDLKLQHCCCEGIHTSQNKFYYHRGIHI